MQPQAPSGKPGSIEGKVVNSVTHAPVAGVELLLRTVQFGYTAVSDEAGRFSFPDVVSGTRYSLLPNAEGYVGNNISSVQLEEDQHLTEVQVQLSPLGVVSGRVLDEDGDPIPKANVQMLAYTGGGGARRLGTAGSATTDDRGMYRVYDLQPGAYFVRVSVRVVPAGPPMNTHRTTPETGYRPVFYPNGDQTSEATRIQVAAGGDVTGIDFQLSRVPVFHVRGHWTGVPAPPVRAGEIRAIDCGVAEGMQNLTRFPVASRPDGSFDVASLPAGTYCVILEREQPPNGPIYARETVNVTDHDVGDVVLAAAEVGDLTGSLDAPTEFQGKVRGFVSMVAQDYQPRGATSAPTGDNGAFTVRRIVPGKYAVEVRGIPPELYLRSIEYGRDDASTGIVTVTTGGGPLRLRLAAATGTLEGSAEDSDGKAAAGRPVIAVPEERLAARTDLYKVSMTDQGGRFRMSGIAPGNYRVFAWEATPASDLRLIQTPDFLKEFEGREIKVRVADGGHEQIEMKLIPADKIDEARRKFQ